MGSNIKRIILIMGTPGVGKTVVSKQLVSKLDAFHVNLADLVTREKLTVGIDEKRKTLIADRARLTKRVKQIIRQHGQEKDIIIDGHYAGDVVPVRDVTFVFVLRRHPEELKKLMQKRGFAGSKIWENLQAEILDVSLYDAINAVGFEKVCEIDMTGKEADHVANDVILILNGKKPCISGTVDWLGKLEQENRLDEFLREF